MLSNFENKGDIISSYLYLFVYYNMKSNILHHLKKDLYYDLILL